MRKLVKYSLILVAIIAIALVVFIATFDANRYKPDIIAQVESHTGRDFKIDGDLKLTLYPWIGLEIASVSLGNASGFSNQSFASIKRLEVKIELMPLLIGNVQVDRVRLHGLELSLEVSKNGITNWADLVQPSTTSSGQAAKGAPGEDGGPPALAGFAIRGIELKNASVRWSDNQTGMQASLADFELRTGTIEFDEFFEFTVKTGVLSNQPDIKARVDLKADIKLNSTFDVFELNEFELNANAMMKTLSESAIPVKLKTSALINLKQDVAEFKETQLATTGIAVNTGLNVNGLTKSPVIKGAIVSNEMNARAIADWLKVKLPVMANAASLTAISLRSRFQATATSLNLDDFKLKIDGSELSGFIHVLDITAPQVRYNLKMQPLVLDGYLPPAAPGPAVKVISNVPSKTLPPDVAIELPVELLQNLDLDGSLEIERLSLMGIHFNQIKIPSKAAHGIIINNPIEMSVIEGKIDAKLGLDVRNTPSYVFDIKGQNLWAGTIADPIIEGVLGYDKIKMLGQARFGASLKTNGKSVRALKKAMTGKIQFEMEDVELDGVDVGHYMHDKVANYLDKKDLPFYKNFREQYSPKSKTAFERIHASYVADQGRLVTKDILLKRKDLSITGSGYVDLVAEWHDHTITLKKQSDQADDYPDKLMNVPMEVRLFGSFGLPQSEFNLKKYLGDVARMSKSEAREKIRNKAKDEKARILEDAKKKASDALKDKLKGLVR